MRKIIALAAVLTPLWGPAKELGSFANRAGARTYLHDGHCSADPNYFTGYFVYEEEKYEMCWLPFADSIFLISITPEPQVNLIPSAIIVPTCPNNSCL